jgi:hypothetical protein
MCLLRGTDLVFKRVWPYKARVRYQANQCEIGGGQGGTGAVFSSNTLGPVLESFHQCFVLMFVYMLLVPEGKTGKAWEPSEKHCS